MTKRGWGHAALVATALLVHARIARGAEVRDGAEYSVTVSGAHTCFVYPAALFNLGACPAEAKPMSETPVAAPNVALAIGFTDLGEGRSERAMVVSTRLTTDDDGRPSDLKAFASVLPKGLVESQPGARVLGEPTATWMEIGGQSVARVMFDMDGYGKLGHVHEVVYVAWSVGNTYSLAWTGPASAAPALDAVADRAAATIRVAHPAKATPSLVVRVLGAAGVPTVIAVGTAIAFGRKRKKRPTQPVV